MDLKLSKDIPMRAIKFYRLLSYFLFEFAIATSSRSKGYFSKNRLNVSRHKVSYIF